jgi:PII-like signaling protein
VEMASDARRVRVYLSEGDTSHHQAAYVRILELLRRDGAAGAAVFRGIAGFGASGHLHTATLPDLAQPLPLVLEWVDVPERVERLLPAVCAEAPQALVTVEDVHRWCRRATTPCARCPRRCTFAT